MQEERLRQLRHLLRFRLRLGLTAALTGGMLLSGSIHAQPTRYQVLELSGPGRGEPGDFTRAYGLAPGGVVVGQTEWTRREWQTYGWTASMWGAASYFDRDAEYARRQLISLDRFIGWFIPVLRPRVTQDPLRPNYDGVGRRVGNTGESKTVTVQTPFLFEGGKLTLLQALEGGSALATAVNTRGQVVGTSRVNRYRDWMRAFLYQTDSEGRRQVIDLGTLGGDYSIAYAINDRGQVVGQSDMGGGVQRGFLWEQGQMQNLPTLGGSQSFARAVNNRGQIAGWTENRFYHNCAVIWEAGTIRELERPVTAKAAYALALNNLGHAVGKVETEPGRTHAALWDSRGRLLLLGTLGGDWSEAAAINDRAQIVGSAAAPDGAPRAILFQDRRLYDLNSLIPDTSGWTLTGAQGINDRGEIVGWGTRNGQTRAFLLRPLPALPPTP